MDPGSQVVISKQQTIILNFVSSIFFSELISHARKVYSTIILFLKIALYDFSI